jgi:putative SOS response-associated peptidase YedK
MMRWGMPPPPRTSGQPVTNIRNTISPHWRGWLQAEEPMPRSGAKAMPVILTTDEEHDVWMHAPGMKRRRYNGHYLMTRSGS